MLHTQRLPSLLFCLVVLFWSCRVDPEERRPGGGGGGVGSMPMSQSDASFGNPNQRDGGPIELSLLDGGSDAEMTCGASPFGAKRVKVNVLLLVDQSGSMKESAPSFTGDRWSALGDSLAKALDAVKDDLAFGMQLFPTPDGCNMPAGSALTVEIGPGTTSVPAIVSKLEQTEPKGGTPTAAALDRALEYYTKGAGKSLEGERYVLLATDGGPNCNIEVSCDAAHCVTNMEGRCMAPIDNCCDPAAYGGLEEAKLNCLDHDRARQKAQALHAAGIKTFVVGIPGSEFFADTLDAIALAGGVPAKGGSHHYFAVDAPDELTQVLSAITLSLVTSCKLQLASIPPAFDKLNVEVEGERLARGHADGWELDQSTSPPTVVIQGESCKRIEQEGVSSVQVVYGCPTFAVE